MRCVTRACWTAFVAILLAAGCVSKNENGRSVTAAAAALSRAREDRAPPRPPAAPAQAAVDAPEGVLQRRELVDLILESNPTLEAARQAWQAARARPRQVATLDDPMLGYSFAPASIGSSRVPYGETFDLSQRVPWPGVLRLQEESAAREAESLGYDYETLRLDLALTAVALFDDYYVVDRALDINTHHVRLLEDFKRVATSQYEAGLLAQQDPIQAEVELAHLAHDRVELEAERRVVVAGLNALLHRPPRAPLPPPPAVLEALSGLPPMGGEEQLGDRLEEEAVAARPELASAAAQILARRADADLAGLEGYPAFDLMLSYNSMWLDEEHRWMTGVRLNVPLWRRRIAAARQEARAKALQAQAKRRAMEDDVRSSVRQSVDRLHGARHVLELYRDRLYPAADDQVRAARAAVESGGGSFLALIEAEKNLRDVELGREKALAQVDRRRAELERTLGLVAGGAQTLWQEPAASHAAAEERQ